MTAMAEASRIVQINITAGVILLFCFFIILRTQQHHHRAPFRHQLVGVIGTLLFFALFVTLIFVRKHMIEETELTGLLKAAASAPLPAYAALFAAGMLVLIAESIYDVRSFRSRLSEYSILQAVNGLNDGLVIFDKNRKVVFANQKMHELSFVLFGQSLYRFVSFPEWIENGSCAKDVYRLPQLPHASYYLPSGEVWQIRRLSITVDGESFSEFVASDISQQYALRRQIEQKNALLKKRQKLMADSAKMIIESNIKEEQLAYKMRIHDSLGQCVTTVSHIMQDSGDVLACAGIWAETVAGLRTYEDAAPGESGLRAFREQLRLIAQLGCTVKHEGPMPCRPLHARIFRDAVRTAAINAVRHAGADTLLVETKRGGTGFDIFISDNGSARPGQLTEGGGLSSLRQEIEQAGGRMNVTAEEGIKISIHLPARENEFFVRLKPD